MSSINPFSSEKLWTPANSSNFRKDNEGQDHPFISLIDRNALSQESFASQQHGIKRKFQEVQERQPNSFSTEMKVHKRANALHRETPTDTSEEAEIHSIDQSLAELYGHDQSFTDEERKLLYGLEDSNEFGLLDAQDEFLTEEEYQLLYGKKEEFEYLNGQDESLTDEEFKLLYREDKSSAASEDCTSEKPSGKINNSERIVSVTREPFDFGYSFHEKKWQSDEDEIIYSLLHQGYSIGKIADSYAPIGKETSEVYLRTAQLWILYISKSFATSKDNWTAEEDKKITYFIMRGRKPNEIASDIPFLGRSKIKVYERADEIQTQKMYFSMNTSSLTWDINTDRTVAFLIRMGWDGNKILNSGHFPLKSHHAIERKPFLQTNLQAHQVDARFAAYESKWNAEEDEIILTLLKDGCSKAKIAQDYAGNGKTTNEIYLRASQLWILFISKCFLSSEENWSSEEDNRITFLVINGYQKEVIANEFTFNQRAPMKVFARTSEIQAHIVISKNQPSASWSNADKRLLHFLLDEGWSVDKIVDSGHFHLKSSGNIADEVLRTQMNSRLKEVDSLFSTHESSWTVEEDEKILSLLKEGYSKLTIARVYTSPEKGSNQIYLRATQLWIFFISKSFATSIENWTKEEDTRITYLLMNGFDPRAIADETTFERRDKIRVFERASEIQAQKIYFTLTRFTSTWSNEEVRTLNFLMNLGWEPIKIASSGHFPDKLASVIEQRAIHHLNKKLFYSKNVARKTDKEFSFLDSRWTAGDDSTIISLLKEGCPLSDISNQKAFYYKPKNEVHERATLLWFLYFSNIETTNQDPWTVEEYKKLIFLLLRGIDTNEIADECTFQGKDRNSVYEKACVIQKTIGMIS